MRYMGRVFYRITLGLMKKSGGKGRKRYELGFLGKNKRKMESIALVRRVYIYFYREKKGRERESHVHR